MPRRDAPAVVAVAVSGGRDSLALLHATLRAARALDAWVLALHVHHGLMPDADAWLESLRARCARWARAGWPLAFAWTRLDGAPAPGESVEAWARVQRYRALAKMARTGGASLVLLAHHREDQSETVLLQALRGAGAAGLAAMPAQVARDGLTWARPWLAQPGAAIDAYLQRWRLGEVVHDPSNADPRFARSRLRGAVMPALREAFPDVDAALAAVAQRAQEARAVLDEVAQDDLARIGASAQMLPHAAWHTLSHARRRNALRAWLAPQLPQGAPESLVQRVAVEWQAGSSQRWPAAAGLELRSYRGALRLGPPSNERTVAIAAPATAVRLPPLREGAAWAVPTFGGHLELFSTPRQGLACDALAGLVARVREGGEQFQRTPRGTARSLKKQYQAAAIPAWERDGPLLWSGPALVFAPGLGIDARAWAPEGTPQWGLRWHPAPLV